MAQPSDRCRPSLGSRARRPLPPLPARPPRASDHVVLLAFLTSSVELGATSARPPLGAMPVPCATEPGETRGQAANGQSRAVDARDRPVKSIAVSQPRPDGERERGVVLLASDALPHADTPISTSGREPWAPN